MKNLNRLTALVLTAIMLLAVSACGKGDSEATTTTTEKSANVQAQGTTAPASTEDASGDETQQSSDVITDAPETQAPTSAPETQAPVTEAPTPTGVKSKTYEASGNVEKQIVYYPAELEVSGKKYPIVSWANGTMCTPDLYTDLLKAIAEGGYIVIASYETMSADGTAQRSSIDLMISENSNSSSLFYGKVDTGRIAAIGHSQGGRSSVNAAVADSRIDCLVSIAGSNYDYEVDPNSRPSLFLSGSKDWVVDKDQWLVPAYNLSDGPAVYACLNGATHTTCCSEPQKYAGYINSWLKAWLYNDATAKATFKNGGALSNDSAWLDFQSKGF